VSAIPNGRRPLSASRGSAHATKVGWTAGGSAEFALSDHFTIKGEALSHGVGHISVTALSFEHPGPEQIAEQEIGGVIARRPQL
jgi:hypothetical protein